MKSRANVHWAGQVNRFDNLNAIVKEKVLTTNEHGHQLFPRILLGEDEAQTLPGCDELMANSRPYGHIKVPRSQVPRLLNSNCSFVNIKIHHFECRTVKHLSETGISNKEWLR